MGTWRVGEEGEKLERIKNILCEDKKVSRACQKTSTKRSLVKEPGQSLRQVDALNSLTDQVATK